MRDKNSYSQILRSSSLLGGASVINILLGLVKTKVAAVLLGPAGVGMIGLLQNLMTTASVVSALGFGTVGTRQIAEAVGRSDEREITAARRALFWGTMGLGTAGAAGFWLLRDILAEQVLQDPARGTQLGWLAIGVALSVASGSQSALLNGLRRVGDLALLSIGSGILSTVLGVAALLWPNEAAVLLFVLATPISSFILGHWFVSRMAPVKGPYTPLKELRRQWEGMVKLGAAFMISGLVVTLGQLIVRTVVQEELGPDALGQFQAAWAISMTYIGFVLTAMGTDYYPRLTAAIQDHDAVNRLANEQTEVALLLAGPIFFAMLGLAPWIVELLYSSCFDETVAILRWQILGDILKVTSWPLGFVILAAGDGRTFLLSESAAIGVLVFGTWLGLPLVGVQATGIGFLAMYGVYLPLVCLLAKRRTAFAWNRNVVILIYLFLAVAGAIIFIAGFSEIAGGAAGVLMGCGLATYSFARLGTMANLDGHVGAMARLTRNFLLRLRGYLG